MSRSPLAYPLTRPLDADAGGAADLQTDIMRFMAILALCLVAIFALVQSIPLAPAPPPADRPAETPLTAEVTPAPPIAATTAAPAAATTPAAPAPVEDEVVLTRPRWVSTFQPREPAPAAAAPVPETTTAVPETVTQAVAAPAQEGFTLRFESDLALTRLVTSGQVGFYAMTPGRAQRMTVSDSRISFWDASAPNQYHEMEAATVPAPVVAALARSGTETAGVDWGVTLPGKLSRQLERLLREHAGGALVITADGLVQLEEPL